MIRYNIRVQNLTNVKQLKLCPKKYMGHCPPSAKCINIWLHFQIKVTWTSNGPRQVFLAKATNVKALKMFLQQKSRSWHCGHAGNGMCLGFDVTNVEP